MDRRLVLSYLLALLALTACTRERPTPEAVPTLPSSTVVETPAPDAGATESVGSEPAVVDLTAEAPTDNAATPSPEAEATEDVTTFQYIVEPGDTLGGIALEYNVAPEDIRRLNNLFSDEIQVGQPLLVPVGEGVYLPGMPTPTRGPFVYEVQAGDTIGSIALKFGKDMIELIEANALTESDILSIGQKILIPDYQPTAADLTSSGGSATGSTVATDGVVEHVVQPGETLGTIAEKYGISSAELARANNIANPNLLREGQVLRIPGIDPPTAARLRGETHVVQSGESMSQIALDYGVTVDAILAANELSNPNDLRVGQELVIPAP
ncbi:MAG: LysM peptidoglycan-binding domain-containing protein [Caldilineaceae bacterium]